MEQILTRSYLLDPWLIRHMLLQRLLHPRATEESFLRLMSVNMHCIQRGRILTRSFTSLATPWPGNLVGLGSGAGGGVSSWRATLIKLSASTSESSKRQEDSLELQLLHHRGLADWPKLSISHLAKLQIAHRKGASYNCCKCKRKESDCDYRETHLGWEIWCELNWRTFEW